MMVGARHAASSLLVRVVADAHADADWERVSQVVRFVCWRVGMNVGVRANAVGQLLTMGCPRTFGGPMVEGIVC